MKKMLLAFAAFTVWAPFAARADERPLLVQAEMIEINAKPADVWNVVKDFDGLVNWLPAFSASPLVKGKNGQIGAVRALTLKDGPTFTEELLAYTDAGMSLTYSVIESPLPIDHYQSSMAIRPSASGGSIVSWIGTWKRKNPRDNPPEAEGDAATLKLISGAYRLGLETVKKKVEGK
jgi:mxaD protein